MTQSELRIYIFERVLSFVTGNYIEKIVERALELSNGDVNKAFEMIKDNSNCLIQGGGGGPDIPHWNWMGGYSSKGAAWQPGNQWSNKPDFTWCWKDIIQYVKDGKQHVVQLELF